MKKPEDNIVTNISIDLKKMRIRIYKSTLHYLGDPKYIQLLVNPKTQMLALRVVETDTPLLQAHRVDIKNISPDDSYEIYSGSFITKLCEITDCIDHNCTYKLTGKVIPTEKIAVFSLKSIKIIEL
ncbi:MAG: hypothetical protein PHX51_02475 [Clostridia bacterium]|nr:hypothetical protein [Clostridia bacterium]